MAQAANKSLMEMTRRELLEAMSQPEPTHIQRIIQKELGQELANRMPHVTVSSNFRLHDPRHHDEVAEGGFYLDVASVIRTSSTRVRVDCHTRVYIEPDRIRVLVGSQSPPPYPLMQPNSIIKTIDFIVDRHKNSNRNRFERQMRPMWEEVFEPESLTMDKIDEEYGIPQNEITCPACSRTYKQCKTVCSKCEECKRCCYCEAPQYVKARELINKILNPET